MQFLSLSDIHQIEDVVPSVTNVSNGHANISENEQRYLKIIESVQADRGFMIDLILSYKLEILTLSRYLIHGRHREFLTLSGGLSFLGDFTRPTYEDVSSYILSLFESLEKDRSSIHKILQAIQIYRDQTSLKDQDGHRLVRESDRVEVSRLANLIWDQIIDKAALAGYEFRYFAFFRSNHPLVRINKGDVKLTPEIYEGGSTLLTIELYEVIMKGIRDENFNSSRINLHLDLSLSLIHI